MTLRTRVLGTIAAGTLALSIGLAAAPAGAVPDGPDGLAPCTEDCGPGPGPGVDGPDDLTSPEPCIHDCGGGGDGGDPEDPGDPGTTTTADVPIPANATFTG
jgi:hypothetical protein